MAVNGTNINHASSFAGILTNGKGNGPVQMRVMRVEVAEP
jgi:hypothetical protein